MVDIDMLKRLYVDECRPMHEVADKMGISVGSVHKYIHANGIMTRPQHMGFLGRSHSKETRERISKLHKGKILSEETKKLISESHKKGGIGFKKKRSDGYISIYFPDHPRASADGYIMEHIIVMEALLGRHLNENECVHHINGNRSDNRKNNLMLMTKSEHMSLHSRLRYEKRRNDLSINAY